MENELVSGSLASCSALPLNSCVTLGKVFELSKPQFPHFYVCLYVCTYIFFKIKKIPFIEVFLIYSIKFQVYNTVIHNFQRLYSLCS